MNKFLRPAAALAGLAVVVWIGAGYVGTNLLALALTALIGAFYLAGVFELQRFEQATATLARALDELSEAPAALRPWLERVPAALQPAVRRRIEGEAVGLPGPALAPALAALLVLLGMLGTFVGMVLTLRGTGAALQGALDAEAVRNALVAPVKGLGLAFGTSVAGVAASAALGLLSALSRRARAQVAQRLDGCIATTLRGFAPAQRAAEQREASLGLLQRQTELMPALVERLQAMMTSIEQQAEATHARLLASQEHFQSQAASAYAGLAASVAQTLQISLSDSARLAGETIRPLAEATLAGIARETAQLHTTLAASMQSQLDQLQGRVEAGATRVAETWQTLLARHEHAQQAFADELRGAHARFAETFEQRSTRLLDGVAASFEQQSGALLRTVQQAHNALHTEAAAREQQRLGAMAQSLEALAASLQREWQAAGAQTLAQQQVVCDTLARTAHDITAQTEAQAQRTSAEIARLVQAAAEAPRAAAEVIAELRQKLSDSMARDNTLLDERARMLDTLGTLLDGVSRAATEQRSAIDALVAASATALERVGARFSEQIDAGAGQLAEVAAQLTGSAVEVASLGEAFGHAVQLFGESSERLGAQLQRIEDALDASMARSDEQLAYYVAQAREVIDLSLLSQKQVIDELQRLAGKAAPAQAQALA